MTGETLRFERLLDAPVETVWDWLTDAGKRGHWFAAGPLEPRVGGTITLVFDHDNLSADDVPYPPAYAQYKGIVVTETIVAYDPPHLLAFTFEGGGEGVARFELSAEGQHTRLVLTHTGISQAARQGTGAGWHSHLEVLAARLAGGDVRDFWALHAESEKLFG